jgi:hypothetical protein
MAKLLGQEIVTQAEFDEFRANDFAAHEQNISLHSQEIEKIKMAESIAEKAILLSKIAAFLSVAAILMVGLSQFAK